MKDLNTLLAVLGFLFALGSNVTWAFVMFGNAQKKAYAAERDFNHLKNNQKSISDGISMGFDEMERRLETLDKELSDGIDTGFNEIERRLDSLDKELSNGIDTGFNEIERRLDTLDKELIEIKSWLIRGFPTQHHQ